jgi:hypothetical protein
MRFQILRECYVFPVIQNRYGRMKKEGVPTRVPYVELRSLRLQSAFLLQATNSVLLHYILVRLPQTAEALGS